MSQSNKTIIIKVVQVGSAKDSSDLDYIWYSKDTLLDIVKTMETYSNCVGCFIKDVSRDNPTVNDPTKISHKILNVFMINSWLCAEIQILDTPMGHVAQSIIDHNKGNVFVGVMSCRAEVSLLGEVTEVSIPCIHIKLDTPQSTTLSIQLGSILG